MTADQFRRMALRMEGAIESAHMNHPDFRVNGRIFATLGYPDGKWGMVALTPDQQQAFLRAHDALSPAKGAWGEQGATMVRLADIDAETLGTAMTMAWQNAVAKPAKKRASKQPPARRTRSRR
jgi:hypothetical protein